jgi:hypothetical protein
MGRIKKCEKCAEKQWEDLYVGKVFGELTCVKAFPKLTKSANKKYLFICSCGKEHIASGYMVKSGNTTACRQCIASKLSGENSIGWKGCGEISGKWWNSHVMARTKHKRKVKLKIAITIEYAWDLFLKQNRKCALTGLEINFPLPRISEKNGTASLDRIDSSGDYTEGNVQWVHKVVNAMKNSLTDDELVEWCKKIIDKRNSIE